MCIFISGRYLFQPFWKSLNTTVKWWPTVTDSYSDTGQGYHFLAVGPHLSMFRAYYKPNYKLHPFRVLVCASRCKASHTLWCGIVAIVCASRHRNWWKYLDVKPTEMKNLSFVEVCMGQNYNHNHISYLLCIILACWQSPIF